MPQKHLCYIRALKGRTAEQDISLESTERDKSTYELGLVGGGFACARLSLVDGEASFFEGHLVVYLAVEASFRRPRWFSLSTERRPLFLASWSAYMLGGLARV